MELPELSWETALRRGASCGLGFRRLKQMPHDPAHRQLQAALFGTTVIRAHNSISVFTAVPNITHMLLPLASGDQVCGLGQQVIHFYKAPCSASCRLTAHASRGRPKEKILPFNEIHKPLVEEHGTERKLGETCVLASGQSSGEPLQARTRETTRLDD